MHKTPYRRSNPVLIAWDVNELLAFPPAEALARLHKHHPYQRLSQVLRGTHYLDRFNGNPSLHY